MRSILQPVLLNILAITAVAFVAPGLSYQGDIKILLTAAVVLALANLILKPLLKVLFIPINLVTLGLLGWLVNVVILYVVTLLVPGFNVHAFTLNIGGVDLVLNRFWAFVVISLMLNLAQTFIAWILRE